MYRDRSDWRPASEGPLRRLSAAVFAQPSKPPSGTSGASEYSRLPGSRRRTAPQPELTEYSWAEISTAKREAVLALVRETRRRKRVARQRRIVWVAVIVLIVAVAITVLVLAPSTVLAL